MTVEADIVAALEADSALIALVSTRIYPDRLPQNPTYPNLVYTRTGANPQNVLEGRSTRQNAVFQFDLRAMTKAEVLSIAAALKDAVETGTSYSVVHTGEADFPYEPGASVYRRMIDYSVWYS